MIDRNVQNSLYFVLFPSIQFLICVMLKSFSVAVPCDSLLILPHPFWKVKHFSNVFLLFFEIFFGSFFATICSVCHMFAHTNQLSAEPRKRPFLISGIWFLQAPFRTEHCLLYIFPHLMSSEFFKIFKDFFKFDKLLSHAFFCSFLASPAL